MYLKHLTLGIITLLMFSSCGSILYTQAPTETAENAQRMRSQEGNQRWTNLASGILQAGATAYMGYAQMKQNENWRNSIASSSGSYSPDKAQAELNQLAVLAWHQGQMQTWQQYTEFCRFNKKADGSSYTFDEWMAMRGQAIMNMKEEGYDIIAEQQEQLRQDRQEMREEIAEDRKRRLERYDAYLKKDIIDNSSANSSSSTTSSDSNSSASTATAQNTHSYNSNQKDNDAKQQFQSDPVASSDYQKVKSVTLYYRDGNHAKVKMRNVDLCKKGAYFYIKIGNTYYPRHSPNWIRFRNAIGYGHEQLYYND